MSHSSDFLMQSRTLRVVCPSCRWITARIKRDDGTWGACNRCGARLTRHEVFKDRRAAQAKADLARYSA